MESKLLELHFAQLSKAWNKTRNNPYIGVKLKVYVNDFLSELYNKLEDDIISSNYGGDIQLYKQIMDFFFDNIDFIDSSTANAIPFELIYSLECVLKDWLDNFDTYIIVTSLRKDMHCYSINIASKERYFDIIKSKYNLETNYRLIQINLPQYLSRDYLSNVVLYHEIGHFIDINYKISESVIYSGLISGDKYFPHFSRIDKGKLTEIHRNYVMEYFADIFAAQYIGTTSGKYLKYIDLEASDNYSESHPSTNVRVEMVNDFLSGNSEFVSTLKNVIKRISKRDISIRYSQIKVNDLEKLIPIEASTENELHAIYTKGWEAFLEKREEIVEYNNIEFDLTSNKLYLIINSLIEKSIGNYIVNKQWQM